MSLRRKFTNFIDSIFTAKENRNDSKFPLRENFIRIVAHPVLIEELLQELRQRRPDEIRRLNDNWYFRGYELRPSPGLLCVFDQYSLEASPSSGVIMSECEMSPKVDWRAQFRNRCLCERYCMDAMKDPEDTPILLMFRSRADFRVLQEGIAGADGLMNELEHAHSILRRDVPSSVASRTRDWSHDEMKVCHLYSEASGAPDFDRSAGNMIRNLEGNVSLRTGCYSLYSFPREGIIRDSDGRRVMPMEAVISVLEGLWFSVEAIEAEKQLNRMAATS